MKEAKALPSYINGDEKTEGERLSENGDFNNQTPSPHPQIQRYKWWIQVTIYTFFIVSGSSVGTILGKLYYEKGGKSNWLATFVQNAGFIVMLPFFFTPTKEDHKKETQTKSSSKILALIYTFLGLFLAADCMLYTIGVKYLPVSTYTVICASQLGFNALFSFLLNKQKLTPFIINSLVLLTISATLLIFETDSEESTKVSKKNYAIGFICTVAASAGYALMLCVTQLTFQKIIKKESYKEIISMSFYQCLVATIVISIGLFASGDWKNLHTEMEGFELGKASYILNLFFTSVAWQIFTVGSVGLIFKVSSLFSNVISMLGMPTAPILSVIVFNDKMTGIKIVSMLLAMWGFVSYIYQHYLDDLKSKKEKNYPQEVGQVSLVQQDSRLVTAK